MSDAPLKTWGMGMICPICDSELVCEERECDRFYMMFVKKPTRKKVFCPTCGKVACDDPWVADAEELVRRSEDAEIEANLLIEDIELVEKVVPMHDDEELGLIIDAMNKNHDTEYAHMAADSILLELLRESHPRTVEAFLRLKRWYA